MSRDSVNAPPTVHELALVPRVLPILFLLVPQTPCDCLIVFGLQPFKQPISSAFIICFGATGSRPFGQVLLCCEDDLTHGKKLGASILNPSSMNSLVVSLAMLSIVMV